VQKDPNRKCSVNDSGKLNYFHFAIQNPLKKNVTATTVSNNSFTVSILHSIFICDLHKEQSKHLWRLR